MNYMRELVTVIALSQSHGDGTSYCTELLHHVIEVSATFSCSKLIYFYMAG